MNADTEKLLRQLEQVTSHSYLDDRDLDAETKLLREGWLALDQILQSPEKYAAVQPATSHCPKSQRSARNWIITMSLFALAATIGSSLVISSTNSFATLSMPHMQMGVEGLSDSDVSGKSLAHGRDDGSSDLAWDDSFDHRLAAASLAIRRAGEGQENRDWHFLRDELLEMSDELTRSSL